MSTENDTTATAIPAQPLLPVPASGKPADPAEATTAEKVLVYHHGNGGEIGLLKDGSITANFQIDRQGAELLGLLLTQFGVLNQMQQVVAEAIRQDRAGSLNLLTAADPKGMDAAEMLYDSLRGANKAYTTLTQGRPAERA